VEAARRVDELNASWTETERVDPAEVEGQLWSAPTEAE
jgi:hypothetical protein